MGVQEEGPRALPAPDYYQENHRHPDIRNVQDLLMERMLAMKNAKLASQAKL